MRSGEAAFKKPKTKRDIYATLSDPTRRQKILVFPIEIL